MILGKRISKILGFSVILSFARGSTVECSSRAFFIYEFSRYKGLFRKSGLSFDRLVVCACKYLTNLSRSVNEADVFS